MAIFGNATVYKDDGTVIYTLLGTKTDVYLNYIVGVLILIFFIVSSLLNPVVFIYKYNQPRSAASLLYMMLSASDFLTTLLRPIILSYELLKPELDDYILLNCTATRTLRICYYYLFAELSSTTTASLAIMRFIAIQFPFYKPRKNILLGGIIAWTLSWVIPMMMFKLWVCNNQGAYNGFYVAWTRLSQFLNIFDNNNVNIITKIEFIRIVITSAIVLAASGFTVVVMLRNKQTPNARSRNKGCLTIVVMNTALIIYFIVLIEEIAPPVFGSDYDAKNTFGNINAAAFLLSNAPVILSAFNPLVIVLFSSQIREFIRDKVGLARPVRALIQSIVAKNEAGEVSKADQPELGEMCEEKT